MFLCTSEDFLFIIFTNMKDECLRNFIRIDKNKQIGNGYVKNKI